MDEVVDPFGGQQLAVRSAMAGLSATLALTLGLALLPLALLARRRWIARRGPVRIGRVLSESPEQLRHLGRELLYLLLELRDSRVGGCELLVAKGELALQLRDPLVTPVPFHEDANRPSAPGWKVKKSYGAIWTTYAGGERLPRARLSCPHTVPTATESELAI